MPPKSRRSFSLEFKLKVLDALQRNGGNVSGTAREFNVARRVVERCRGQEETQRHLARKSKKRGDTLRRRRRLTKSEGSAHFSDLEDLLYDWIREQRNEGLLVHGRAVQSKAKQIANDLYGENGIEFKASGGWLSRFYRRKKLVSRRVTSVGQELPTNADALAEKFIADTSSLISTKKLPDISIANMDESPYWFDMPTNDTIDVEGVQTVRSKTTGNTKMRFTVVLTALASGRKLKPMIIFHNLKNVPNGNFPRECFVAVSKSGTMSAQLMQQWMQHVWKTRPGSIFNQPALLTMDRHRSHTFDDTVKTLKQQHNTDVSFVPGGMTSLLQPCDVTWNKPLKDRVREKWGQWLDSGEQEFTRTGKRRKARYDTVATWIVEAWRDLPGDVVKQSFRSCGVGSDVPREAFHSSLQSLLNGDDVGNEVCSDTDAEFDESDQSESGSDSDDGGDSDRDDAVLVEDESDRSQVEDSATEDSDEDDDAEDSDFD